MSRLFVACLALVGISGSLNAQSNSGNAPPPADSALPSRVVREVTAIFNDNRTNRVRGDFVLAADSVIGSDIAILRGTLRIAGRVEGRVVAINANVVLEPSAVVQRDIIVVGGSVSGRENGTVVGDIRSYRASMALAERGDSIVADPRYDDAGKWWSDIDSEAARSRSRIVVRGDTYNRVEGLPVLIGPSVRVVTERLRANFDVLGIVRTADRVRWDSHNIGHNVSATVRGNRRYAPGAGLSLFDVVQPIESWQLSEHEAGLSTFLLHRDYRDYYSRHGGAAYLSFHAGYEGEVRVSYSNERWSSRDVRDTWTIFSDDDPWRANPLVNDGKVHTISTSLRYDTRNSSDSPWAGWLISAEIEHGAGDVNSPDDRETIEAMRYARTLVDLRRYNRISAAGQFNIRLVYGARLGENELPLQKRFSLGGPGSLPGFDFRRQHSGVDVGMCSRGEVQLGRPALCERIALLQLEYRGDLAFDLFGGRERDWDEFGHHPGAQWVVFTDAGRGWQVGTPDGELTYSNSTLLPALGTFRTDIGAGLDFGWVGFFMAKAVSQSGVPANFFVRLQHRF